MFRTYGLIIVLLLAVVGLWYIGVPHNTKPITQVTQKTSSLSPTSSRASAHISVGIIPTIPFKLDPAYTIHIFAKDLGSPRDLQFTPGGTLLVSNPTANHVIALPDKNHDGVADAAKIVISNEQHVHGLAFYNGKLYVADTTKVVRYNWDENALTATKDKVLFNLPSNNDHNNRTIVFNSSGQMFISLGSTCNVCKETPATGGSVLVSDADGTAPQVFATGLRNAAFLAINPVSKELWGTEMGRDYLGDNTPPDEINIIRQGQNYGWPYCYDGKTHDDNFDPQKEHTCDATVTPIYSIPAHSAPLGLAFINSPQFPTSWQGDLLVAYHGDWNRSTPIGFKIVHLRVKESSIISSDDFLTGFLQSKTASDALGRPVDMAFDTDGNLYVSDDKAGNVYIIQKQ